MAFERPNLKALRAWPCNPTTERGRGILVDGRDEDGLVVYTCGRTIVIRSIVNLCFCVLYSEHHANATVARFSPRGNLVASGDVTGTIRIWSWDKDGITATKKQLQMLQGTVKDISWSEDGKRIVCCGEGRQTRARCVIWESGNSIGEFDGVAKIANSCDFRLRSPYVIAIGSEDFKVNLYEGPPFKFKSCDLLHTNFVNSVRFSPCGQYLASCSSDCRIFLRNAEDGRVIGECKDGIKAHNATVYAVAWTKGTQNLLSVSADKSAKLWSVDDPTNPALIQTFTFEEDFPLNQMQVGAACVGDSLVTVSLGGTLNVLDQSSPYKPQKRLWGHCRSITSIAGDMKGKFYSSSYDGTIFLWEGAEIVRQVSLHKNAIVSMQVVESTLISCGLDNVLMFSTDGSEILSIKLSDAPMDMSASQNHESVAVLTTKELMVMHQRRPVWTGALDFNACVVALSPDAELLAVGSKDGKIYLFELVDNSLAGEPSVLEKHRGEITCMRFSSKGTLLGTACNNRETIVWDIDSRTLKKSRMVYHSSRIDCIAFSPDDSCIATGSLDESILVYDLEKPASQRIEEKRVHPGGVSGMVWQEDGTLITAGRDCVVRAWAMPSPG